MGRLKTLFIPLTALLCVSFLSGCYTQIAPRHTDSIASRPRGGSCDTGDCYDVAPSSDRREICVWERDFLGFPEMRCYNTNYYSSWVYFHNTPWWYRNHYGWRDTRGCPPYYYYDRIAGICRHHSYVSGGGSSGSGSGSGSAEPPPQQRRNAREAPPVSSPSVSEYEPMFNTGGTRLISPAGSPITSPSTTVPSTTSSQAKGKEESTEASTPSSSSSSSSSQSSTPPTQQGQPPQQQQQQPPPRRNSRGM